MKSCTVPGCTRPATEGETKRQIESRCHFHREHPHSRNLCPCCAEKGLITWIGSNSKTCTKHQHRAKRLPLTIEQLARHASHRRKIHTELISLVECYTAALGSTKVHFQEIARERLPLFTRKLAEFIP
jgi:hypothetical protein